MRLQRICSGLGIPNDFNIAQINRRPDYDPWLKSKLHLRARSEAFEPKVGNCVIDRFTPQEVLRYCDCS